VDRRAKWPGPVLVFLVLIYSSVLILFAGLAFVGVVLLGAHWVLAVVIFGVISPLSVATGSWLGFRSTRWRGE
jgi:hypothetical protein